MCASQHGQNISLYKDDFEEKVNKSKESFLIAYILISITWPPHLLGEPAVSQISVYRPLEIISWAPSIQYTVYYIVYRPLEIISWAPSIQYILQYI